MTPSLLDSPPTNGITSYVFVSSVLGRSANWKSLGVSVCNENAEVIGGMRYRLKLVLRQYAFAKTYSETDIDIGVIPINTDMQI